MSICSGGTEYIISGSNLHIVEEPRLLVHIGGARRRRRRQAQQTFTSEVRSLPIPSSLLPSLPSPLPIPSSLLPSLPSLPIPSSLLPSLPPPPPPPQPCKPDQLGMTMSCMAPEISLSSQQSATIGVEMDGVTSLRRLALTVDVHPNPRFQTFSDRSFSSNKEIRLTVESEVRYEYVFHSLSPQIRPRALTDVPSELWLPTSCAHSVYSAGFRVRVHGDHGASDAHSVWPGPVSLCGDYFPRFQHGRPRALEC